MWPGWRWRNQRSFYLSVCQCERVLCHKVELFRWKSVFLFTNCFCLKSLFNYVSIAFPLCPGLFLFLLCIDTFNQSSDLNQSDAKSMEFDWIYACNLALMCECIQRDFPFQNTHTAHLDHYCLLRKKQRIAIKQTNGYWLIDWSISFEVEISSNATTQHCFEICKLEVIFSICRAIIK